MDVKNAMFFSPSVEYTIHLKSYMTGRRPGGRSQNVATCLACFEFWSSAKLLNSLTLIMIGIFLRSRQAKFLFLTKFHDSFGKKIQFYSV